MGEIANHEKRSSLLLTNPRPYRPDCLHSGLWVYGMGTDEEFGLSVQEVMLIIILCSLWNIEVWWSVVR